MISNKKGFTLVEVLVSIVVMAVVMLGLAYAYIVTAQRNYADLLRQKGEETVSATMERLRSIPFDNVTDEPSSLPSMDVEDTQHLRDYCDPADGTTPDDPENSGQFVYRSGGSSQLGIASAVNWETVYKVFDTTSGYGVDLPGTKTVVLTICWRYRDKLMSISKKTVIQEGGL